MLEALKHKYYCFLKIIGLYHFKVEEKVKLTKKSLNTFSMLTIALYASAIITLNTFNLMILLSFITKIDLMHALGYNFVYYWAIIFLSSIWMNYNLFVRNYKFLNCKKELNPNLYLVYLIGSGIVSLCCLFLNKKFFS